MSTIGNRRERYDRLQSVGIITALVAGSMTVTMVVGAVWAHALSVIL